MGLIHVCASNWHSFFKNTLWPSFFVFPFFFRLFGVEPSYIVCQTVGRFKSKEILYLLDIVLKLNPSSLPAHDGILKSSALSQCLNIGRKTGR